VLVIVALAFAMPSAQAHSQLVSTSPTDGAELAFSPDVVSFTFDETLLAGTATISINDDAGNLVTGGPVDPEGTTVSYPMPSALASGTYQAAYRVVSGDGHAVTGAITFTIAAGGASSAPASVQPSSSTAVAVPATPAPQPAEQDGGLPIGWIVALLAVAAVVVAIVVVSRRRP
jgi:methionine-rich copper-binding protein CopC